MRCQGVWQPSRLGQQAQSQRHVVRWDQRNIEPQLGRWTLRPDLGDLETIWRRSRDRGIEGRYFNGESCKSARPRSHHGIDSRRKRSRQELPGGIDSDASYHGAALNEIHHGAWRGHRASRGWIEQKRSPQKESVFAKPHGVPRRGRQRRIFQRLKLGSRPIDLTPIDFTGHTADFRRISDCWGRR